MSRVYRPRHPESTVFYSVLFHYSESFLLEYENRFERHFGHLRPIIQEVVDKYLDCGNLKQKDITPGIIAVLQSFGSRINFHPHLHFLVTEGRTDKKGQFHKVSQFNDPLLCRFFTLEVFSLLLEKKLINKDLVQKILHWCHPGFNVHSKVRTETKEEAERVGKYMIRPILSLKRLSLDKTQGQGGLSIRKAQL